jgi:N-acetylmuramoyl-L-alanine amidase CwlA
MNLQKLILTENECYKAGKKMKPSGIMLHSTAANNPRLSRYVGPDDGKLGENKYNNHWNHYHPGGKDVGDHTYVNKNGDGKCDICGGRQVCVHAFIGKLADGSVATYQTLPWDHRGWHAGGTANNTHIGFEICEDDLKDATYFGKVYKEAAELCAFLCKQYGLTEKDIIDHSEGFKKGIACDHSDVGHWFPKHGKTMDDFREDVKKLLNVPKEEVWYQLQVTTTVPGHMYKSKSEAEKKRLEIRACGFNASVVEVKR